MEATAAPAPVQNPNPNPNPNPPSISGWSNIVKKQADQKPQTSDPTAATQLFVESCKSTKGIAMAVVDANAIIQGGDTLSNYADKLVSVPEVMAEVRDPVSRHRLAFTPFQVQTMEPSPESLNKVIKFARATGDLQTLSDVDLKLIALTYTLEAQIHGTDHLRDCPPPVHTVNVRRLPEKDLPGWGNNVPNLEEWEALEDAEEENSNPGSRVLPLKDINLNVVDSDSLSVDGASVEVKSDAQFENQEDGLGTERRYRRNFPKMKEIKIEGKKMVSDGIDASQGQFDDNAGEWMPAVSRSTHRRFLRRKARRESCEAFSEKDAQQDAEDSACGETVDEARSHDQLLPVDSEEACHGDGTSEASDIAKAKNGDEGLSSILKQTRLEEDSLRAFQEGKETNGEEADGFDAEEATADNANLAADRDEVEMINEGLDHLEISSQTNESVDTSNLNDDHSEQSWMLRSLSESSVACITGDFAMQNVILQMGLRLVAPGGMQIRQLHRWILKCHACNTVTAEIGKIFCPKCGNGGTLRKVAVTVGENGIVLEARRTRFQLRGTRFSLPLPRGGRDAITKNPILREDQLPQKFLHQKTKKKAAYKEGDEIFTTNDFIFCHHTDKRAPLQPPMRKALAVFSGRRNPNDNHYSHPKH